MQCKAVPSQKNIIVVLATVARHQTLISCDVWRINITKCKSCELQRERISSYSLWFAVTSGQTHAWHAIH